MSAIFDALQAAEQGKVAKTSPALRAAVSNRILLTPMSFGIGLSLILFLSVDFYLAETSARSSIINSLVPINDYVKSIVIDRENRQALVAPPSGDEFKPISKTEQTSQIDLNHEKVSESVVNYAPVIGLKDENIKDANPRLALIQGRDKALINQLPPLLNPLKRSTNGRFETLKTIQALVAELRQTIEHYSNDDSNKDIETRLAVEKKLKQLEARLTPDNLMVLRMKAYWLQKQGSLMAAMSSYEGILILRPNDMQASLNMVLLEISQGKNQTAMQRLNDLEFAYPDSSQLLKFRNQVVAHSGI